MEDHFLLQIAGDPDNKTLLLIYADWLDEQGDLLGELIRTELEFSRAKELEDYPRMIALARNASAIRRQIGEWDTSHKKIILRRYSESQTNHSDAEAAQADS